MERHRFERKALLALATAWAAAAMPAYGQGLEVGCTTGGEYSPGAMTRMGFPCPVGAGPDIPAPPSILSNGDAGRGADAAELGPRWVPQPAGAAGVSASSRMPGAGEGPDTPDPGDPRLPGR